MRPNFRLSLRLTSVILIMLVAACSKQKAADSTAETTPLTEVQIITAKETPTSIMIEIPGRLEAYRQAEVRARVAGIVTERLYQEGQDVKKGMPLFLINPELLTAARDEMAGDLALAEANHANALDKLARYKDLVSDQSISQRDYRSAVSEELAAKAAVLSAKAKLDKAKLDLGYAKVTAPISGVARRALVTEGALVGQDTPTPLTTIEQIDPIYVNFSQPASNVMALQKQFKSGKVKEISKAEVKVKLIMPDGSEYPQTGQISFTDLAVNPNTDAVEMRAIFNNPNKALFPGAYVQVALEQAVVTNAILIPRDALIRKNSSAQVMTLDSEDKVILKNIEAKEMKGKEWVVTKGLASGDRVIVSNLAALVPGTKVKAVEYTK
jgi:membrane fusion protein, multidrug efflux system